MPEIWLKYGTTDIVLDIKFENLLKHVSSDYPLLTDDEIKSALKDVIIGDNTLILAYPVLDRLLKSLQHFLR